MRALIYRVDSEDLLVYANPEWDAFAEENCAPELRLERVRGRSLFDFITSSTVRAVYLVIVGRAMEGALVRYRFRCDSPCRHRDCLMQVRRVGDDVEFTSTILQELPRGEIPLLRTPPPSSAPREVRLCSSCHAVTVRDAWVPLEAAAAELAALGCEQPMIQYRLCPACRVALLDACL